MTDEILKKCKRHGALTRAQVYSRNRVKVGTRLDKLGQSWECKICSDKSKEKYLLKKKNRPPKIIVNNINLGTDEIAAKKAAIFMIETLKHPSKRNKL